MYRYPSQTEKGVRHVSYAMILFLIVSALGIVLVLALMPLLAAILAAPGGVPDPSIIGSLIAVLAAGCGIAVMELVGGILGLLGVLALSRGKMEFGPDHAQRFDRAVIVLVFGIILPIIGGGLAGTIGSLVPGTSVLATVGSALGIAGAALIGLFLLWSVEGLAAPDKRQLGMVALILGVVAGIAALVVEVVVLYTVPIPTRPEDITFIFFVPSVVGYGISIVSIGLWYVVYKSVLDRFTRGELQPIPPVPMYPAPYAPPYAQPYAPYYPPPYVPAPPPQPPAQPPPQNPPPNP